MMIISTTPVEGSAEEQLGAARIGRMRPMAAGVQVRDATCRDRLDELLVGFEVDGHDTTASCRYTHSTMLPFQRYAIPADRHEEVVEAYRRCVDEAHRPLPCIVERHCATGPLRVNFNMFQQHSDRLYTTRFLKDAVGIVSTVLSTYVAWPDMGEVLILEKPCTRAIVGADSLTYRDGVHLIWPDVTLTPALQYRVRDAAMPVLAPLFHGAGYGGHISEIYDEYCIERHGWLLYGGAKPGEEHAYTISHRYSAV